MIFSGQKKETFLITKNFNGKIILQSNLILSPEFYWVKRVTLNVNFAYEVKKMAPSLFESTLPSGEFEYLVFKLAKNDFTVIAFDISKIKEELKQLNIDLELVDKIYTLESEFLGINISSKVDENFGVVSTDGIVVYAPLKFLDTSSKVLDILRDKKLTKNYIYSKQSQKLKIEPKQLILLIWIVFLLNSIVVLDIIKIQKNRTQLLAQKENFIEENRLPQTSFQIKSMQDELKNIDKTQNDLRESIYYVSKFKLQKNESFKRIRYIKNKLKYSTEISDKRREKEFKKYLKKRPKSAIVVEINR